MFGRMGRTRATGAHHTEFRPVDGSFEFTGENQLSTRRNDAKNERLARAAVAVLLRIGS